MAKVIPLNPEDVAKDFVCPICLSVPLDPYVLTKCNHVFCEDCIKTSFDSCQTRHRKTCPVCRTPCTRSNLKPLSKNSPLAHRIWSNIAVKCEYVGCNWTGSISEYESHRSRCLRKDYKSDEEIKETIKKLTDENDKLKTEKARIEKEINMNKDLIDENQKLKTEKVRFVKELTDGKIEKNLLKRTIRRMTTKIEAFETKEQILKEKNQMLIDLINTTQFSLVTACDDISSHAGGKSLNKKKRKVSVEPVTTRGSINLVNDRHGHNSINLAETGSDSSDDEDIVLPLASCHWKSFGR